MSGPDESFSELHDEAALDSSEDDLIDAGLRHAVRSRPVSVRDPAVASLLADRYRLDRELGSGGMGVVFEAVDRLLGRRVAVKLLRPELGIDDAIERFREESRIAASLEHPGIVAVHDAGTTPEGRPYFVMRLVRGDTLRERLSARELPGDTLEADVLILQRVAEAVAYAHDHAVVHRDLKPSNIMLGSFGAIHVMDWGIARVLSSTVERPARAVEEGDTPPWQSRGGTVLGTPAYMAPEQARGQTDQIDARADVFALGAILCEILTGFPPYIGADSRVVRDKAARADLEDARARLDRCGAPSELVELAVDCLAPDATTRPHHASEVALRIADHRAALLDRAKASELDAARRTAEVASERRVRRLTALLATLIVLAVSVGAYVLVSSESARWARREDVQREVVSDLARAETLRADALAKGGDAAMFERARGLARSAARLAERDGAATGLRDRARAVLTLLESDLARAVEDQARAARDHLMVQRLEEARGSRARDGRYDTQARLYCEAFAAYGVTTAAARRDAEVELCTSSAIRDDLVVGLHWWCVALRKARGSDLPERAAVLALGRAVDPPRDGRDLWTAIHERDPDAVRELGGGPELADLPAPALTLISATLQALGDREAAIRVGRQAVDRGADFWGLNNLALLLDYEVPEERQEARELLSAARALAPENVAVMINLAGVLLPTRLAEADALAQRALLAKPDLPPAHLMMGRVAAARHDHQRAEGQFLRSLELDPGSFVAWHDLGLSRMKLGDRKGALMAFDRTIALAPTHAAAHANRSAILLLDGRAEEAIEAAEEAVRLLPTDPVCHHRLGNALTAFSAIARATESFAACVRLAPTEPSYRYDHGSLLVRMNRLEEAVSEFREAARWSPDDARARVNLAQVLRVLHRYEEALPHLEAGAKGAPASRLGLDAEPLLRACREEVERERLLRQILARVRDPADPAEFRRLVSHCEVTSRPAVEAVLWDIAFAIELPIPEWDRGSALLRSIAAPCLAAAGRGDGDGASPERRAAWCNVATDRLALVVERWVALGGEDEAARREARFLQTSPDFEVLRRPSPSDTRIPEELAKTAALFARLARFAAN